MLSSLINWWRSPSSRPRTDVLDVIPQPDLKALQQQL